MIGRYYCTIIGNTLLPSNKVTSWNIKILNSHGNDGDDIYIGVAPFDIDQNKDDNRNKCGWYFDCFDSELYSGPPHNYSGKKYGPRKRSGSYVRTGDSVGVIIDTINGYLSFPLNGMNYGVAYKEIPLDKPLVSCVLLENEGDSAEFDPSEVKEIKVDNSIHVPFNFTVKNITWDSITLSWDVVDGSSFYQIETDGNKSLDASTTSAFTKRGFLPDSEHNFRVRTVKDNAVSEWSDVVKKNTLRESFETSGWKECPDNVDKCRKYSVDENNPRIALKNNSCNKYCTIIANTPIPLNKVTSWSIKMLKSKSNDGNGIFIGVAPSDINQNEWLNYDKCGWYFACYSSSLCSGPPHNYSGKEYGPRKKGTYVRTGDIIGVVMDMTHGELSFVLDGMNHGVAYEGIPLDKPLVPCVLLGHEGDSVEIDNIEVKEYEINTSISIPSNITTNSGTWDSITLTWNKVEEASFYQIEVDGNEFLKKSTTNAFAKRGFLPGSEHSFRVRTVKDNKVSEWSGVVKKNTLKKIV